MGRTMAEAHLEPGRQEGNQLGKVQVLHEILVDALNHKFRKLRARIAKRIKTIDSVADLKTLIIQIADARTLEELPFAGEGPALFTPNQPRRRPANRR